MKLDRVKVAFGAASVVLFGVLVACGGDDDDDITSTSSSSGNTVSSSSSSGNASSSGGASSGGASSGGASSSGGANSCVLEYGCTKTTTTKAEGGTPSFCAAGTTTTYTRTKAPEPTDASVPVSDAANPCTTDGSDPSQCLAKQQCDIGGTKTTSETKVENDGKKSTTISTVDLAADAGNCTTTTVYEIVEDSLCDVDAGPDSGLL